MRIILTDNTKACSYELIRQNFTDVALVAVNGKSIRQYNGNTEVCAIVGSRALAIKCQDLNFPNCHFFQLISTGFDDIDTQLYKSKGIQMCNAKNVYDETVAEYAVYMMLTYAKRYHKSLKLKAMRPLRNYHYISELKGKTVGLMGVGNIGSSIARILKGFDMNIIGYAQKTKEKENFSEIYHPDGFKIFLSKCDFIINVLPHLPSTQSILGKEEFSVMKPTSVFINVGRESIYDRSALIDFYRNNKEAVGILDIFELLPNPFSSIHRLSNIYITPRIAAYSKESDENIAKLILDNLKNCFEGRKLKNIINE